MTGMSTDMKRIDSVAESNGSPSMTRCVPAASGRMSEKTSR